MDSRIIVRVLVAASIAAFGICGSASADTITFDGFTGITDFPTYTEKGFEFSNDAADTAHALATWGDGAFFSADPSATSATLFNNYENTTTTLTRVGGGAFDLKSIDFAFAIPSFSDAPFDLTFNFRTGAPTTISYALDDTQSGLQTFLFDQHDLLSVSWKPTDTIKNAIQWDNVTVTPLAATPIPATLPLFLSSLGVLGAGVWRRRAAKG
jgi:hypothetical protein